MQAEYKLTTSASKGILDNYCSVFKHRVAGSSMAGSSGGGEAGSWARAAKPSSAPADVDYKEAIKLALLDMV